MLSLFLIATCSFFRFATAVFADDAWHIDYHYALLGEPKEDTTFFHRPNRDSKASLLYTLSHRGVLGAVNPKDGSIVWRHWLAPEARSANVSFLAAVEGQDIVISGIEDRIDAWSAPDGRQAWSRRVSGPVGSVEMLDNSAEGAPSGTKDVLVAVTGEAPVLQCLDGETGDFKWQHEMEGNDLPHQVSASATEVVVVSLQKSMLGTVKIKTAVLDPITGKKKTEATLNADSELAAPGGIVRLGAHSGTLLLAWTHAGRAMLRMEFLHTHQSWTQAIESPDDEPIERVRVHQAPDHANAPPHFLVHCESKTSHWARVYHVDRKKGSVRPGLTLPKVGGSGVYATSTSDGHVYFTRVTGTEMTVVSSASERVLGSWPVSGLEGTSQGQDDVRFRHAVSELSVKGGLVSAIRAAVLTSTGQWALLRNGSPVWQRPEVLADTVSVAFAAPSVVEEMTRQLQEEAHRNFVSAYVHRVVRHVGELRHVPTVLSMVPQRLLNSFLGTSAEGGMQSDTFGFHQIVACGIEGGRVLALDAGSPDRILWSKPITLDDERVERPVLQGCPGVIEVRHAQRRSSAFVALNATTGELLERGCTEHAGEHSPGQFVSYTLREGTLDAASHNGSVPLWQFTPSVRERIHNLVSRPINDPVASIGKVLGDRRVLYKYLDPNLALLTTVQEASNSAAFYILNTVSGAVLHSSTHTSVDLSSAISSIVSENWFAYSFTSLPTDETPKGHLLVVGEMFESLEPNDRGPLSITANFSSTAATADPFTLSHAYQISEPVSKLAVTTTKQGITSRQLIAVVPESHGIVGIPRPVLDPRRPLGRDPTKDEQAEGLIRYSPTVDFDPKWHLTHARELLGITDLVTTPALVESTSLLFAFGLDVFGTRLSPSFGFDMLGKGFDKFQMLGTVLMLFVATVVVGPLVRLSHVLSPLCFSLFFSPPCFALCRPAFVCSWTGTAADALLQVTRKQVDARWQFT